MCPFESGQGHHSLMKKGPVDRRPFFFAYKTLPIRSKGTRTPSIGADNTSSIGA